MKVNVEMINAYLGDKVDAGIKVDAKVVAANVKAMNEEEAAIKQALALLRDQAEAEASLNDARAVLAKATADPRAERLAELKANPPKVYWRKQRIIQWEREVAELS